MIRTPRRRLVLARAFVGLAVALLLPVAPAQDTEVAEKVRLLEADLDHKLEFKRIEAISELGLLGPESRRVLPKILSYLESSNDLTTLMHAARAAARIDPENEKTARLLTRFLEDRESSYALREVCAVALGEMAEATPSLAARIVKVLSRELGSGAHGNVVDTALAGALGRLGEAASSSVEDVKTALARSPFGEVQVATFLALSRVSRSQPGRTVEELAAGLDGEDLEARAVSFGQLRAMGAAAAKVVPALIAVASSQRPLYERVAAIDALSAIAPGDPPAIGTFLAAAGSDDEWLVRAGDQALGQVRPGLDRTALEALLGGLISANDFVRQRTIFTLSRVAPQEPRTIAAMLDLLGRVDVTSDTIVVYSILEALRAAGTAAGPAASRLVRMLDRNDPIYAQKLSASVDQRIGHSLVVLSEIGIPPDAVPRILAEFESRNAFTLAPAIRAIGALGPAGAPAVPGLVALLEGPRPPEKLLPFLPDADCRVESIRALGRMGPAARAAIGSLTKIAGQDARDPTVAGEIQAARTALQEIQG